MAEMEKEKEAEGFRPRTSLGRLPPGSSSSTLSAPPTFISSRAQYPQNKPEPNKPKEKDCKRKVRSQTSLIIWLKVNELERKGWGKLTPAQDLVLDQIKTTVDHRAGKRTMK